MHKLLAVAVLILGFTLSASASVTGSQGFVTPTLTQADASPTGNINTSLAFTLDDFSTTHDSTGIFAGLPTQNFGNVSLNLGLGNGLQFGNSLFGHFQATSTSVTNSMPGFLDVLMQGMFTPGTFRALSHTLPVEIRLAFTQTPPMDGSISASGTLAVSSVVPEPSTLFLFGTGLLAMLWFASPKIRKRWTQ